MSIYGCFFLFFSVVCGALSIGISLPEPWGALVDGGAVLFGMLFVISLVLGRRIKFDPILR
ncbi:hypothetical protein CH92_07875 [Stutzerimonas stutzeri]|uniref:Uncharacterized protein n=1 Tax=Stutzerimonas stutzeri TaxID=316 RepID=W8R9I2_STUST|nr:hypothetical protein CH92_07875 [Stutzerimonas stutzeri]